MADRTKINKVFVIGTVEEVNTQVRNTADGREYINGKVVVKTTVNDKESMVEFKVLAFALTKAGTPNKVFASYKTLDGMVGKRVKVTGEFREGSMVNQSSGVLNKFNELYLKFINVAKIDELDCATFEFSGFVVKPLYERKDKEDKLLGYRIEVAQANYNNTSIQVIKFDVDKNDVNIAQAIESNYSAGATVSFSGNITYIVRTETRTEEVAFGDPIVKTFVINDKTFRITGGNAPFEEDDPAAYSADEIKKYIADYKAADAKKLEEAKNGGDEEAAPAVNSAMSKITRASSLI